MGPLCTRGQRLKTLFAVALACSALTAAEENKPLVVAEQGSFFVGGETKSSNLPNATPAPPPADITVNQMYVQFQKPVNAARHAPVVMVHGCCLSSKTWETTPDGRMGWNEYFVRKGRSVYLADQVSRARSGFDPTIISQVKSGAAPPASYRISSRRAIRSPGPCSASGPLSTPRFPMSSSPCRPPMSSTSR